MDMRSTVWRLRRPCVLTRSKSTLTVALPFCLRYSILSSRCLQTELLQNHYLLFRYLIHVLLHVSETLAIHLNKEDRKRERERERERDPSQTEQNHTSRWSVSLNRQGNPWNPGACGGGGGRRERWPMPLPPRTAGVTGRARTGRRRGRVSFNAYGFWLPVWSSIHGAVLCPLGPLGMHAAKDRRIDFAELTCTLTYGFILSATYSQEIHYRIPAKEKKKEIHLGARVAGWSRSIDRSSKI